LRGLFRDDSAFRSVVFAAVNDAAVFGMHVTRNASVVVFDCAVGNVVLHRFEFGTAQESGDVLFQPSELFVYADVIVCLFQFCDQLYRGRNFVGERFGVHWSSIAWYSMMASVAGQHIRTSTI
jgi:hypothetical protein